MSSKNQQQIYYLFSSIVTTVTCIKFMLIPAYYSTDFEVHRNWMAITINKPFTEWYTENTSKWTLDYPPFFAYFELILAYFAKYFDPLMLQLSAEPYTSPQTVFYQRLTIILSDIVYYYAVYVWIKVLANDNNDDQNLGAKQTYGLTLFARSSLNDSWTSPTFIYIILFVFNVGHLIVDHIHFQYNGLLNGLLLLSMVNMIRGNIYWSSFWFAVLLNFKHIYLYMAPAYFIFLLTNYCFQNDKQQPNQSFGFFRKINFSTLFGLTSVVLAVFAISFGPFIYHNQLLILLARLFPFQRGLSHAYWAPNFWALYNGLDLVLAKALGIKPTPIQLSPDLNVTTTVSQSLTSGLVQQTDHQVLFSISPKISIFCVLSVILFSGIVYFIKRVPLFNHRIGSASSSPTSRRRSVDFIELIIISALSFYTFGYHVHEKAILLIVPLLIPLILANQHYGKIFLLLSTVGYYSLFPLLYREAETPIKILLLLTHCIYSFHALNFHHRKIKNKSKREESRLSALGPLLTLVESLKLPLLNLLETVYLLGLVPVQLINSLGPFCFPSFFSRYQFLPLMLISVYCSVGILYCFALIGKNFIFNRLLMDSESGFKAHYSALYRTKVK